MHRTISNSFSSDFPDVARDYDSVVACAAERGEHVHVPSCHPNHAYPASCLVLGSGRCRSGCSRTRHENAHAPPTDAVAAIMAAAAGMADQTPAPVRRRPG